jgi:hypothetical protein
VIRVKTFDNEKITYRILSFLRKSERYDEFDDESFTPEHFGVTDRQFALTLERMIDDGHVKGVSVKFGADGYPDVRVPDPRITRKGLEYLQENDLMRKAARLAKGIDEIASR